MRHNIWVRKNGDPWPKRLGNLTKTKAIGNLSWGLVGLQLGLAHMH